MKRSAVLFGCAVILSGLSGCQSPTQLSSSKTGVEVTIENGGEFPEFMVGKWKANKKSGWELVFEPDGTISSAVISFGRVKMKPGEITTVPMQRNGKGVFEPGEWLVHYAPPSRELTVKVSLKNFYVELGKDVLEGKSTDIFVGTISEDGKVWLVDWTSFFHCTAHTDKYPNFDLSADPNYGASKSLIFEKVTP